MPYPKVSVVIINWNGKPYLERFLPALVQSSYPNMELVVGDNASTDGSVEFLATGYPRIKVIALKDNYGFADGYNRVLKQVTGDYYILLNSDVEVTPGWIEPVIAMMERDMTIAAAQPAIRSWLNKDRFEYAGAAGGFKHAYGYTFCRGRIFDTIEADRGQYADPTEIFWASGAALFIRSSCWFTAGGFDARFFAHMEEVDLCWRLKRIGWRIVFCPQSLVYHVGGGTLPADSPYKTYLNFRNNLLMLKKNLPASRVRRVLIIRYFLDFISMLRFTMQGKMAMAGAISKAHRDYIKMSATIKRSHLNDSFSSSGLYRGSIVWDYFVRKRKTFSSLKF